jgi:hypothetical protein
MRSQDLSGEVKVLAGKESSSLCEPTSHPPTGGFFPVPRSGLVFLLNSLTCEGPASPATLVRTFLGAVSGQKTIFLVRGHGSICQVPPLSRQTHEGQELWAVGQSGVANAQQAFWDGFHGY